VADLIQRIAHLIDTKEFENNSWLQSLIMI
jgi:hypothetical protein